LKEIEMLRLFLSATALTFALAATTPAIAQEMKMPRTISLVGHGEFKLPPDMAVVTVGVLSPGTTAAEALSANTESMSALFAALKAAGIAERDIQTSNFMVQPRYDYNQNTQPPKLVGYDVSNNVTVTVRKVNALGGLLDTLVKAGSNQINGVMFDISKRDAALDEARRLATQDAARKASLYAQAMKLGLGPVLSISEGVSYEPPIPLRMKAERANGMSADVPIAGGEQTLSVDVNITWEIR
jgi:uncharacterized protein